MKVAALILCSLALASALEPGLVAKICAEGQVPGLDCRYAIPTTVSEALNERWQYQSRGDDAYLPGLGMLCPSNDYTVCVLYDKEHLEVAGIQMAIPVDGYKAAYNMNTLGFGTWTTTLNNIEVSYWTSSIYFVESDAPEESNGEIIRDGLWIPDNQGNLMEIPRDVADLSSEWSEEGCIDTLGTAYLYKIVTDVNCEAPAPWFTLYQNSTLIGAGFYVYGTMPETPEGSRVWFESLTLDIVEVALPDAPDCVYETYENYGISSLNIVFAANVTEILCDA